MSVGGLLVGIGVIHNLFGLAFGLGWLAPPDGTEGSTSIAPLVDIARAGFLGAVEPDPLRMEFFWFVIRASP